MTGSMAMFGSSKSNKPQNRIDCLIGAGTTITGDVPADALALSRSPQINREGAAPRIRSRQKKGTG